jgi:lysophospholipase L1-like esterase
LTLAISAGAAFTLCEGLFRVLEWRESLSAVEAGELHEPDPRWGWRPSVGGFRRATSEFDVTGQINELHMNDAPVNAAEEARLTRLLVLGDSHTFAIGASMEQTWVKVLERRLDEQAGADRFRCYNAAAIGYNLHQYLLRLIDQGPLVRPHYVVVGLSYATDFYDLLPPDRGGWVYGGLKARDYFDFDEAGRLVERHSEPEAREEPAGANPARTVRGVLDNFATFRFLRRSKLALFIGSHVRFGGQSMWPNMEVVVEREISPRHDYQWQLALALLKRIHEETRRLDAELIVVGVPYLAQVYDDIWAVTFGGDERYNRTAATARVREWCESEGIAYVETLDAFQDRIRESGRWLHFPKDAHPTPEGHELIAETLLRSGLIRDVKVVSSMPGEDRALTDGR